MKPLLTIIAFVACLLFSSAERCEAQLLRKDRPVAVGLNWNEQCALESVAAYANCRNRGGGYFSCTVTAGLHYWACSGSNFQTSFKRLNSVRASMVGRRVLRRSR